MKSSSYNRSSDNSSSDSLDVDNCGTNITSRESGLLRSSSAPITELNQTLDDADEDAYEELTSYREYIPLVSFKNRELFQQTNIRTFDGYGWRKGNIVTGNNGTTQWYICKNCPVRMKLIWGVSGCPKDSCTLYQSDSKHCHIEKEKKTQN